LCRFTNSTRLIYWRLIKFWNITFCHKSQCKHVDTAKQRLNAHFKTVDGLSFKILLIKVTGHLWVLFFIGFHENIRLVLLSDEVWTKNVENSQSYLIKYISLAIKKHWKCNIQIQFSPEEFYGNYWFLNELCSCGF
jgi:hypothetical protein